MHIYLDGFLKFFSQYWNPYQEVNTSYECNYAVKALTGLIERTVNPTGEPIEIYAGLLYREEQNNILGDLVVLEDKDTLKIAFNTSEQANKFLEFYLEILKFTDSFLHNIDKQYFIHDSTPNILHFNATDINLLVTFLAEKDHWVKHSFHPELIKNFYLSLKSECKVKHIPAALTPLLPSSANITSHLIENYIPTLILKTTEDSMYEDKELMLVKNEVAFSYIQLINYFFSSAVSFIKNSYPIPSALILNDMIPTIIQNSLSSFQNLRKQAFIPAITFPMKSLPSSLPATVEQTAMIATKESSLDKALADSFHLATAKHFSTETMITIKNSVIEPTTAEISPPNIETPAVELDQTAFVAESNESMLFTQKNEEDIAKNLLPTQQQVNSLSVTIEESKEDMALTSEAVKTIIPSSQEIASSLAFNRFKTYPELYLKAQNPSHSKEIGALALPLGCIQDTELLAPSSVMNASPESTHILLKTSSLYPVTSNTGLVNFTELTKPQSFKENPSNSEASLSLIQRIFKCLSNWLSKVTGLFSSKESLVNKDILSAEIQPSSTEHKAANLTMVTKSKSFVTILEAERAQPARSDSLSAIL